MHTRASNAEDPFVTHLRQIEATERDKWVSADEACTKAAYYVNELRQRLVEAERELAAAEQEHTVAAERLAVVREIIADAERLLTQPDRDTTGGTEAEQPDQPKPRASSPGRSTHDTGPAVAPTVRALVLEALADGKATQLSSIRAHVQRGRPQTPPNSVRSTIRTLCDRGQVALLGRATYRLVPLEAHT
ncbi:hypothetical protein [Streptomyces sp. NBC_01750]|uniref:hypothetical protein n=1 Tax=Streptomyces sp. NBC_01750 TaxID=2975928 RepID=UPI002DDB3FC4|nr:hypothetical protein [Streptomyces sp. NBC_01750]WSD33533.1 hypothetical protein OG966_17450 [Streptomyces sp. NBC_01750]